MPQVFALIGNFCVDGADSVLFMRPLGDTQLAFELAKKAPFTAFARGSYGGLFQARIDADIAFFECMWM